MTGTQRKKRITFRDDEENIQKIKKAVALEQNDGKDKYNKSELLREASRFYSEAIIKKHLNNGNKSYLVFFEEKTGKRIQKFYSDGSKNEDMIKTLKKPSEDQDGYLMKVDPFVIALLEKIPNFREQGYEVLEKAEE